MKKKIIFISLFFVLIAAFLIPSALTLITQAQTSSPTTLDGLNETAKEVTAFKDQTSPDRSFGPDFLASKVGQIISLILSFVGVLFFILMIYAGITWMTAQGNEQQVTKAKSLLMNAVIGIIIVFAAYAIIAFLGTEILNQSSQ